MYPVLIGDFHTVVIRMTSLDKETSKLSFMTGNPSDEIGRNYSSSIHLARQFMYLARCLALLTLAILFLFSQAAVGREQQSDSSRIIAKRNQSLSRELEDPPVNLLQRSHIATVNQYAVFFATNKYEPGINNLENPVKDAREISKILQRDYGFKPIAKSLVIENPTSDKVIETLRLCAKFPFKPNDQLLIYFAGHGKQDEVKLSYLILSNSKLTDSSKTSWFSRGQLRDWVLSIAGKCKHVLLVIDTCDSGTFDENVEEESELTHTRGVYENFSELTSQYFDHPSWVGLASSSGKQKVSDGKDHSPFAERLIEALTSHANAPGILTFADVMSEMLGSKPLSPIPHGWQVKKSVNDINFIFFSDKVAKALVLHEPEGTQGNVESGKQEADFDTAKDSRSIVRTATEGLIDIVPYLAGLVCLVLFGLIAFYIWYRISRKSTVEKTSTYQGLSSDKLKLYRQALLRRIYATWIDDVFHNALHTKVRIALSLRETPDSTHRPWNIVFGTSNDAEPNKLLAPEANLTDVFEIRQPGQSLLILGNAGGGKTSTLLELGEILLKDAMEDESRAIPVVLILSSWHQKYKTLKNWISHEMRSRYELDSRAANVWLDAANFTLLLDGLDEVAKDQQLSCIRAINAFKAEYSALNIVVCCRKIDYDQIGEKVTFETAILIEPLSDEQIELFLASNDNETLATFVRMIEAEPKLKELAQSPLMLQLMSVVFAEESLSSVEQLKTVDDLRSFLFDRYIETMLKRKGLSKQREVVCTDGSVEILKDIEVQYSIDETRRYLSYLASEMSRRPVPVFFIELLQPDWFPKSYLRWLYRVIAGTVYGFCNLALFWAMFLISSHVSEMRVAVLPFFNHPIARILLVSLTPIPLLIGMVQSKQITFLQPIRLDLHALRFPKVTLGAIQSLILTAGNALKLIVPCAIALNLVNWVYVFQEIIDQIPHVWHIFVTDPQVAPDLVRILCLVLLLPTLLWIVLISSVILLRAILLKLLVPIPNLKVRRTPNAVISKSTKTGLMFGGVFLLLTLLILPLTLIRVVETWSDLDPLILVPSSTFLGLGLFFLMPVVQHFITRMLLAWKGYLPFRLTRFLDFACDKVLLERVNGGYRFIHQLLQEHLSDRKLPVMDLSLKEKFCLVALGFVMGGWFFIVTFYILNYVPFLAYSNSRISNSRDSSFLLSADQLLFCALIALIFNHSCFINLARHLNEPDVERLSGITAIILILCFGLLLLLLLR